MSTYGYDPAQVTAVGQQVESEGQRFLNMINELATSLNSSLAEWQTDSARAAYNTAKAKWDEASTEIPQLMRVMTDCLDNTINDYTAAEKVGSSLFAG